MPSKKPTGKHQPGKKKPKKPAGYVPIEELSRYEKELYNGNPFQAGFEKKSLTERKLALDILSAKAFLFANSRRPGSLESRKANIAKAVSKKKVDEEKALAEFKALVDSIKQLSKSHGKIFQAMPVDFSIHRFDMPFNWSYDAYGSAWHNILIVSRTAILDLADAEKEGKISNRWRKLKQELEEL